MDMDFAVKGPLVRRYPPHPVFVHRLVLLLGASFRPRLAAGALALCYPSPPSGWWKTFTSELSYMLGTPWGRRLGADLAHPPAGPAKPRQRCPGTALHTLECGGSTPLWGRRLGADLAHPPAGPAKPRQRCPGTALHTLECGGSTPLWGRRLGADLAHPPAGPAKPRQRCPGTALHTLECGGSTPLWGRRLGADLAHPPAGPAKPRQRCPGTALHTLECGGSTPLWGRRLGADLAHPPAGPAKPRQRCPGTALHTLRCMMRISVEEVAAGKNHRGRSRGIWARKHPPGHPIPCSVFRPAMFS